MRQSSNNMGSMFQGDANIHAVKFTKMSKQEGIGGYNRLHRRT